MKERFYGFFTKTTDKKEKEVFFIYKETPMEPVAKSYKRGRAS
jgi:hypothetical protein